MKNFFIFIGGFICGIISIIIIGIGASSNNNNNNLMLFEKEGKCFHTNQIHIFQALNQGEALGMIGKFPDNITVLLIDENKKSFYDDEIVELPKDKCARQIGTYRYETREAQIKTVPVVVIK